MICLDKNQGEVHYSRPKSSNTKTIDYKKYTSHQIHPPDEEDIFWDKGNEHQ